MWDSMKLTSRGGNSIRRIFTYAMSAFVAAFLWILLISPSTSANAADAIWSGSDITYQGKPYDPTQATSSSKPTLATGTTFYEYIEITMTGELAHTIYFPTGTAATSTSASYAVYNMDTSGNYGSLVTSQTISISPQAPTGSAATDAIWTNGAIVYDGNTYIGDGSSYNVSTGSAPPLKAGIKYYEYFDISSNKAYLIYFSATSDPPKEKSATLQSYDTSSNGSSTLTWSNPSATKTISITPVNGTSSTGYSAASTNGDGATSCAVQGIGWIVCPVTNFLASGMDTVFDLLKGFLVVTPLSTNTSNSLYKAWSYIRSIANVAFVIAFLIIIYSQITNVGITNYSIKKLLPRLIIAAVLVNVSYIICAAAVDISNILGNSLDQFFLSMKATLSGPNTTNVANWQSITGFVLGGGTAAAAAGVGIATTIIATGGSAGAAIILLLPVLLALILAVLVALIVLAARQALIIILIIAAPLAFVAYLLPNTEKWFERWRKLFIDMLVFFPIFSVIFGGSQLAGSLIFENSNQIDVIILGMFVQAAPLILTPLLIRFSGEVVGKLAGYVNNPRKGFVDRTRNWAKDRSELLAAKNLSRTDPVRNRQVFRRYALGNDQIRRKREGRKAMYGAMSDARWANSSDFQDIDQQQRFANDQKSYGESVSESRYTTAKTVTGAIKNLDLQLKDVKVDIDTAHAITEANWDSDHSAQRVERRLNLRSANERVNAIKSAHDAEWDEIKSGRMVAGMPATANVGRIISQARNDTEQIAVNAMRSSAAKRVQLSELGQALTNNNVLRRQAAGIDTLNNKGEIRILADVKAQIEAEKKTLVENIKVASEVKAGNVNGFDESGRRISGPSMRDEFNRAVATNNAEMMRAYADMLADAGNPGVDELRKALVSNEAALRLQPQDTMEEFKSHVNASSAINAAAEDIASWSRDGRDRNLLDITQDVDTWSGLSPIAFSNMKKSSQLNALSVSRINPITGNIEYGISPATANQILHSNVASNLKPDVLAAVQKRAKM